MDFFLLMPSVRLCVDVLKSMVVLKLLGARLDSGKGKEIKISKGVV